MWSLTNGIHGYFEVNSTVTLPFTFINTLN